MGAPRRRPRTPTRRSRTRSSGTSRRRSTSASSRTSSSSRRGATPTGTRADASSRPPTSAPPRSARPGRPRRHAVAPGGRPSAHGVRPRRDHHAARERLRAKLSYTNIGFALAPDVFTIAELREVYAAALGYDVSATNLQRVLLRRGLLVPTGERRESGPSGGRPPALFRFRAPELEVTDPFAVLRPPSARRAWRNGASSLGCDGRWEARTQGAPYPMRYGRD